MVVVKESVAHLRFWISPLLWLAYPRRRVVSSRIYFSRTSVAVTMVKKRLMTSPKDGNGKVFPAKRGVLPKDRNSYILVVLQDK